MPLRFKGLHQIKLQPRYNTNNQTIHIPTKLTLIRLNPGLGPFTLSSQENDPVQSVSRAHMEHVSHAVICKSLPAKHAKLIS